MGILRIIILMLLMVASQARAQSFTYSYVDPCTKEMKFINADMSAPIILAYYGQVRSFTYEELQNGSFDSWMSNTYDKYKSTSPCQGAVLTTTTTNTSNQVYTVINSVMSITSMDFSSLSNLGSVGGLGNSVGKTTNSGTDGVGGKNDKKSDSKKDGKVDGQNNPDNSNNPNAGVGSNGSGQSGQNQDKPADPNNPNSQNGNSGSSGNNNPDNTGGTGSNGSQSGGGTTGSGSAGGGTTGSSGSGQSGSGNPGDGTQGSGQTGSVSGGNSNGTDQNGGGQGNGGSSGSSSSGSGTNGSGKPGSGKGGIGGEEKKEDIVDPQEGKGGSGVNVGKAASNGKAAVQKPAILVTGDIVGVQTTENGDQDARGTMSFTSVKGDGTASIGISADYMVNAKIGNISAIKSWIGVNKKGNKHINLVNASFNYLPKSWGTTGMFIRVNSLKNFTALYGVAGSYGSLFEQEIISTLAIAGFMYKGKLTKSLDATIIAAGVYSPYSKYYSESLFESAPVVIPFLNLNYKMTKTFGIGLTGGGTYIAGQNVINYQVLLGAKLLL